jgi:hypothetical protein
MAKFVNLIVVDCGFNPRSFKQWSEKIVYKMHHTDSRAATLVILQYTVKLVYKPLYVDYVWFVWTNLTCLLQTKKCGIRAQYCLLKWWPRRPNFVFGDQNVNLVASVTTSIIEVGDRKVWIIFHQREKNIELEDCSNHWKNICFYLFTLYLWLPIFFYFSH